jgi:type III secretion system FlhB-like substrate exporter
VPDQQPRPSKATALRYETGASAPKVTATGRGLVAERILEEAERAGVPIRRDAALAEALGGLQLGHEVPEELWAAVAEALAWAYALDARAARTRDQA